MFAAVPLTVLPLVAYNLVVFLGPGPGVFDAVALSVLLPSGAPFTMSWGDMALGATLVILFLEILKATRTGTRALVEHGLSIAIFVVFLLELVTVRAAATPVFALMTVVALIDVVAGYTITATSWRRDVSIG